MLPASAGSIHAILCSCEEWGTKTAALYRLRQASMVVLATTNHVIPVKGDGVKVSVDFRVPHNVSFLPSNPATEALVDQGIR